MDVETKKCRRCECTYSVCQFFLRDKATGRRDRTCFACRAEQQRTSRDRFKWPVDEVAPTWNAWRYPATAGQLTWRV